MNEIKINIIIPVYKAGRTIRRTLESLVWQEYKNFRVTMVQDGDGLNYLPICNMFRERGLDITLLQMPENGGPGAARQMGLDNDFGSDYICFLDADDMILPEGLRILVEKLEEGTDIITSNFLIGDKLVSKTDRPCTWFHGNLYRTEYLVEKRIRFNPSIRLNEDSYFNFVAFNLTKKIQRIEDVTRIWCDNDESITRKDPVDFFKQSWRDYIFGMCDGMNLLKDNGGFLHARLVAATLIFVYSAYMTAIYFEFDMTEAKAWVQSVSHIVNEYVHDADFWMHLHENLTQTRLLHDTLIFYQTNFKDWLDNVVLGG